MKNLLPLIIIIAAFISACGGQASGSVGDSQAGQALFHQASIGEAPSCMTCHSVVPGMVIVGPSLAGVALRARARVPGMTADEYLRTSILSPNSHVVEGFSPGVMYQKFQDVLTAEQVNDLVAYLLTLK